MSLYSIRLYRRTVRKMDFSALHVSNRSVFSVFISFCNRYNTNPNKYWTVGLKKKIQINIFSFLLRIKISFSRYLALLHPFSKLNNHVSSHSALILVTIWILGTSYTSLGTESTKAVKKNWLNETYYNCKQHVNRDDSIPKIFSTFNFSLTFAIPLIIMAFLYSILSIKLMSIMNNKNVSISEDQQNCQNDCNLRRNSLTISKHKVCEQNIQNFIQTLNFFFNFFLFIWLEFVIRS